MDVRVVAIVTCALLSSACNEARIATPTDPSVVTPPPPPVVQVMTLNMGEGTSQTGEVGMPLSRPLAAKVLVDGAGKSGVTVRWFASNGNVPASSLTGADGIAVAIWTLGTKAGLNRARASLVASNGVEVASIPFVATAVAGTAATIRETTSVPVSIKWNACSRVARLAVTAFDRFNNPTAASAVSWQIVDGPLTFVRVSGDAEAAYRSVDATGLGVGHVTASLSNGAYATFTVAYTLSRYEIMLDDQLGSGFNFKSLQNCTGENGIAAVDTIPVGESVRWLNGGYSDVRVVGVGNSMPGSSPNLPMGGSYTFTFTIPGVYRYTEASNSSVIGTILVR